MKPLYDSRYVTAYNNKKNSTQWDFTGRATDIPLGSVLAYCSFRALSLVPEKPATPGS